MTTNLERDVHNLKKELENHVGDNGVGVHALGNDKAPGFISPENTRNLKSIFNGRTDASGKDIDKLAPGFYYGTNFLNAPNVESVSNGGLCLLDITRINDGYRQAALKHSYLDQDWTKTIHNRKSGLWGNTKHEVLLWSGNVAVPNQTMPLAETCQNFTQLKVVFNSASNGKLTSFINVVDDYVPLTYTNLPDRTTGQPYTPQMQMGEIIMRLSDDWLKFYIQWNTTVAISTGAVELIEDVGAIREVWGVR